MCKILLSMLVIIVQSIFIAQNFYLVSSYAQDEVVRAVPVDDAMPAGIVDTTVMRGIPAPIGPKKAVAVRAFDNKTNWSGQINLGEGMSEQLITALMDTGCFLVVEREHLRDVLNEQDFQVSGRAARGTQVAQIGSVLSPQIEIKGAVTEFTMDTSTENTGMAIRGFSIGGGGATARVAVDIRIYDTTTGQILASQTCADEAEISEVGFAFHSRDFSFGHAESQKSPLGLATRRAINRAVQFIIQQLNLIPWEGRIVSVKDTYFYINCGKNSGIHVGDQFNVYSKGEDIIDEYTGENLGSEKSLVGRLEVVSVDEKFSKAIAVKGHNFAQGSIIKFE